VDIDTQNRTSQRPDCQTRRDRRRTFDRPRHHAEGAEDAALFDLQRRGPYSPHVPATAAATSGVTMGLALGQPQITHRTSPPPTR
jgi:hypothetical protein